MFWLWILMIFAIFLMILQAMVTANMSANLEGYNIFLDIFYDYFFHHFAFWISSCKDSIYFHAFYINKIVVKELDFLITVIFSILCYFPSAWNRICIFYPPLSHTWLWEIWRVKIELKENGWMKDWECKEDRVWFLWKETRLNSIDIHENSTFNWIEQWTLSTRKGFEWEKNN